jgi:hypothetical protein
VNINKILKYIIVAVVEPLSATCDDDPSALYDDDDDALPPPVIADQNMPLDEKMFLYVRNAGRKGIPI